MFTAQLRASRHVTCLRLPQWRPSGGFWKRRNIMPPFQKDILQQMCHLFYLKGATEGDSEPVCYWRTLWITCVWLCWLWLVWSKGVSVWEKDQHIAAATETCMLLGALQSARKCLDDIRLQHNSEATVRLSIMSAATWEGKKQVCKFHETLLWRLLALPTSRVAPDCG